MTGDVSSRTLRSLRVRGLGLAGRDRVLGKRVAGNVGR